MYQTMDQTKKNNQTALLLKSALLFGLYRSDFPINGRNNNEVQKQNKSTFLDK